MAELLKVLFMGTPRFGAIVLSRLADSCQVTGVVTQPDRPAGRKNTLTPPAVKLEAERRGLPVLQLEKLRRDEDQARLREFAAGAEVFVVASFGMLLPQAALDIPPRGCLNVHASLLPAYRGASPVAQAILDGLERTGVTIMLMEKGLDSGPLLSRVGVPISPDDTQPALLDRLAVAGAELLLQTLPAWVAGQITPEPQDHSRATYTGIIKKEAGRIDWREPAVLIERKSRAYDPWPGIYTYWSYLPPGQPLKLGRCDVFAAQQIILPATSFSPAPGQALLAEVAGSGRARLMIATGDGFLAPRELQLPGKKMLPADEFVRGYRQFIGAHLG